MKYIFLLITASLIFCSCSNKSKTEQASSLNLKNSAKDSVLIEAGRDYENNSLKYYYSGIASCPPKLADHLKEHYNIEIINKIDVADINDACYNEFTDSVLFNKSGKRFSDFYKEIK